VGFFEVEWLVGAGCEDEERCEKKLLYDSIFNLGDIE
jgi:hypothetical protein